MKKIMTKLMNGQEYEVLLSVACWDGVGLTPPIIESSAVKSIRLVDESECEECGKTGEHYCYDARHLFKPEKIERISPAKIASLSNTSILLLIIEKINEIIEGINE